MAAACAAQRLSLWPVFPLSQALLSVANVSRWQTIPPPSPRLFSAPLIVSTHIRALSTWRVRLDTYGFAALTSSSPLTDLKNISVADCHYTHQSCFDSRWFAPCFTLSFFAPIPFLFPSRPLLISFLRRPWSGTPWLPSQTTVMGLSAQVA